ncbi:hypothetical protein [Aliiroseovarius sp.]|uniref:hypothetical protein n=1 Tax=Aliiroseovarius sp. TaxID=1872442 RepID=UPI003BA8B6AA
MAHQRYSKMSGGYWVWSGAEYFVTVKIAEKIRAAFKGEGWAVFLEEPLNYSDIRFRRGAPAKNERRSGRVDVAAYEKRDNAWSLRSIVEVKSGVAPSQCVSDIKRIVAVLEGLSEPAVGCFAFYSSHSGKNLERVKSTLRKRAESLQRLVVECAAGSKGKLVVEEASYKITEDIAEDNDCYLAFAITIEREV